MAKTISINKLDDARAALATIASGDEVKFNDGTHNVAQQVTISRGGGSAVRVVGANRRKAIVRAADGQFAFRSEAGSRVELIDLACDGPLLAPEGRCTFIVDGCEIFNFLRGPNVGYGGGMGIGLPSSTQPQNASITRTTFRGPGYCGFGFYRGDKWKVTDCTFDGVKVPIKSNNVGATDIDGLIDRIRYKGVSGPIEEMQGCARGFVHTRTIATDFVLSGDGSYCLGHSIIYHGRNSDNNRSEYHIIRGNRSQGLPRIGIEAGDGYTIRYYDIDGGNVLCAVFMGDSSGQVPDETIQPTIIEKCRIRNMREGRGGLEAGGGQGKNKFFMDVATINENVAMHELMKDSDTWGDPFNSGTGTGTGTNNPPPPPPLVAPISVFGKMQRGLNVMNGWGGVEVNMHVGGTAANDGGPLTIKGTKYATGLGCHAPFAADYDLTDPANEDYVPLADRCRFTCGVGIDDATGGRGSITFRVLADGKEVFQRSLTAAMGYVAVSVDLPAGTRTIKLVGDDGGDGGSWDHLDVIDAKVVEIAPVTPNAKLMVISPANVDVISTKVANAAGKPKVGIARDPKAVDVELVDA